ncbi:unnamed protein product [Darwinula stevensoni]|uniref:Uncharacterized protein n=1 Tax=Darwinula stevensoni TaxID=69355 RepID=A0A7R9FRJ0_9CRUS|nr:unnamed protein product [Darwinula stevensoni]CAG0901480.1 unnamed protein product [Darwinula stevensoni]
MPGLSCFGVRPQPHNMLALLVATEGCSATAGGGGEVERRVLRLHRRLSRFDDARAGNVTLCIEQNFADLIQRVPTRLSALRFLIPFPAFIPGCNLSFDAK